MNQDQPTNKFDLFIQSLKQWILTIINEASIGLYQIQTHLKESIKNLRQLKRDEEKQVKKLKILHNQQDSTLQELKGISKLNSDWALHMQKLIQQLQ